MSADVCELPQNTSINPKFLQFLLARVDIFVYNNNMGMHLQALVGFYPKIK